MSTSPHMGQAVRVERLSNDILGAIALREMLFQRELDRQFVRDGGKLYYAVDAAILNSYFGSQGRGINHSRITASAARIFEGPPSAQPSETERRALDILIAYLFDRVPASNGQPLLLLPGHAEEATVLHDRLLANLDPTSSRGAKAKKELARILEDLERSSPLNQLDMAESRESELHALLYSIEDSNEQLRRFNKLVAEGKLRRTDKLQYDPGWLEIAKANSGILPAFSSEDGDGFTTGSADWWRRQLDDMPLRYVSMDKRALATLDRANRALKDHGVRIVLLTDNGRIAREGLRYRPLRHSDPELGQYTFSDLYLRHPKAMLFEPDILLPGSHDASNIDATGWLDAFLTRVVGAEAYDLISLRARRRSPDAAQQIPALAVAALEIWPEIHEVLYADWQTHVGNITLAHSATSELARTSIELRLAGTSMPGPERFRELSRQIDLMTEDSWNDFVLTATKSGYEMIGLSEEKVRGQKRNVPVMFLRDMGTEEILDLIYAYNGPVQNEVRIRELLSDLDQSNLRSDRYLSAVCYALLFAFADRWSVAKTLAKRAVCLASGVPERSAEISDEDDQITGREALYLAAVTHRLTARSTDDLRVSETYLARAWQVLRQEWTDTAAGGVHPDYPEMTGLRFECEEVALATARTLFVGMQAHWKLQDHPAVVDTVRFSLARIRNLLESEATCMSELIRRSSQMGLRTNYFAGIFLLECAAALEPSDLEGLHEIISAQVRDLSGADPTGQRIEISAVDQRAMTYAASFLEAVNMGNPLESDHFRHHLALYRNSDPFLMPYDNDRYQLMEQMATGRSTPAG